MKSKTKNMTVSQENLLRLHKHSEARKIHTNKIVMAPQVDARKATKMYLTAEEKRELMKDCGNNAFILYQEYLQQADEVSVELDDKYMSSVLGWKERTIQALRLKLIKTYWFKKYTVVSPIGNDVRVDSIYFFTKEVVLNNMTANEWIAEINTSLKKGTLSQEQLDIRLNKIKLGLEKNEKASTVNLAKP